MIIKTSPEKPWLVLIHGLGVTEKVWFAPLEEKTKFISFKSLLKEEKEVTPFAERCTGRYNIASWTQNQYSTIDDAAVELKTLVESIDGDSVVLLAHSRGGLVARRAIQRFGLNPKALICLAAPHYGSKLADLIIRYFKAVRILLPYAGAYESVISELCTGSSIITDLNSPQMLDLERHIPHYDIGGDSTYYLSIKLNLFGGSFTVFRMMGSVEKLFSSKTIPEWHNGSGDGFVSLVSCKSPITPKGHSFVLPVNHANILIDKDVSDIIFDIMVTAENDQLHKIIPLQT